MRIFSDRKCESLQLVTLEERFLVQEIKIGELKISQNTLLRIGLLTLALVWLYFDVLRKLLSDWWVDENYSHGLLVPFIGGYAIWQNRERFQGLALKPLNVLGWIGIITAVVMLWGGTLGAELFSTRISLVGALISLILYFAGFNWLKHLSFPLVLLLLAIPIPAIIFTRISFPLQLLASDYAATVINWLDIPAFRNGNVIELAQMKLEVVEACSGIRSLMSLTTLAVTYAYFTEPRWWRRILLIASVVPIAIFTNAARVTITGVMAHYRGEEAAQGFQHAFSGWLIFIVAMLMLLVVAQFLRAVSRFLPENWR